MNHRPRKIITRVIVFLLLGAIVNVAVAWGCALWPGEPQFIRDLSLEDARPVWSQMSPSGWVGEPSIHRMYERFGITRQSAFSLGALNGRQELLFVNNTVSGWPLRSLGWLESTCPDGKTAKLMYVLPLSRIDPKTLERIFVVPTRPIWSGFAINTIFYAAILGLLFFAPGQVRRTIRRRRGLCPACAYPIGTSPVCTECGKHLAPGDSPGAK